MARQIYRKKALDRLDSPEQLDQLLTIVSPMGWAALLALVALVIWAIAWGFTGTIPTKVSGRGVLMKEGKEFTIEAEGQGLIQELFVEENDLVRMGQIVVRIQQAEVLDQIQAVRKKVNLVEKKTKKDQKIRIRRFEINIPIPGQSTRKSAFGQQVFKRAGPMAPKSTWTAKKIGQAGAYSLQKSGRDQGQNKWCPKENSPKYQQNQTTQNQTLATKKPEQEELLKANQELEQAQADLKELLTQLKTTRRVISP